MCPRCHENVFQCRSCHVTNYNYQDAFLCYDCGASNFVTLDWSITAVTSFSHSRVSSSEDVTASLEKCDELMKNAHGLIANLAGVRGQIDEALSPANPLKIKDRIEKLNGLYNEQCSKHSRDLTEIVQHVAAIRHAIGSFLNLIGHEEAHGNMCYNCRATYLKNGLEFLGKAAETPAIADLDTQSLLISFIDSPAFTKSAVDSLVWFCRVRPGLTEKVVLLFERELPNPSPHLVRLLAAVGHIEDRFASERFKAIARAVTLSARFMNSVGSITPQVLQPLVGVVLSSKLIVRQDTSLKRAVLSAWAHRPLKYIDPLEIWGPDVLKALLVDCNSKSVRAAVGALLRDAAGLSAERCLRVYDFLCGTLSGVERLTSRYEQCLDVMRSLIGHPVHQRRALFSGFYDRIFSLLATGVARIRSLERSLVLDLEVGLTITLLAKLLQPFFAGGPTLRFVLARKTASAPGLVRLYFQLRALVIQRSTHLADAISVLRECVAALLSGSFAIDADEDLAVPNACGRELFIAAAMDSIPFGHVSVVRELASILFPKAPELNVPIVVSVAPGHLNYLPHAIRPGEILSHAVGPLMRHLRNHLCADLGLHALLGDDHGMELLVRGNLIDLGVAIQDVYRHLWVPAEGERPMSVVLRLQGLDPGGEPRISAFPGTARDDARPDVTFAYTRVLAAGGGFAPLLEALRKHKSVRFVEDAIRCLNAFAAVRENREALAASGGIRLGFDILQAIVEAAVQPAVVEAVVQFIAALVADHAATDATPATDIAFIFRAISLPVVRSNEPLLSPLVALVPPLASVSHGLMEQVTRMFIEGLTPKSPPADFNMFESAESKRLLNGFGEFTLTLPANDSGNAIRDLIFRGPFVGDAVALLSKLFRTADGFAFSLESLDSPTLPAALKTLAGMVSAHPPTQQLLLDHDLVPMLLELERQVSKNSIGELAGNLLARAELPPSACTAVISDLRDQLRGLDRARAERERARVVADAGTALPDALRALMDGIDDEDSWECCICKEGYGYCPADQLGFYVNTVPAPGGAFSTTHFSCVHFRCHSDARSGSHEWEAAAVRNCERPCNAIFPIPAVSLPPGLYTQNLVRFFEKLFPGGPLFAGALFDVAAAIARLAGSRLPVGCTVSNTVAFIPFMVYAGHALLEKEGGRAAAEKRMEKIIAGAEASDDAWALSLWTLSREEWGWARLPLLSAALRRLSLKPGLADGPLFEACRASLRAFVLTDRLQIQLKDPSGAPAAVADGALAVQPHAGAPWIAQFMANLAAPEGFAIVNSWRAFAEELEAQILQLPTADAAFEFTGDTATVQPSPLAWIRAQIAR